MPREEKICSFNLVFFFYPRALSFEITFHIPATFFFLWVGLKKNSQRAVRPSMKSLWEKILKWEKKILKWEKGEKGEKKNTVGI